ncbi:MAG: hypothetical protein HYV41_03225 [Candidatus Magasanikbacteria bacterium]|nr:hypothetical protein [Candidatus Magasanikbacteria bacterium]
MSSRLDRLMQLAQKTGDTLIIHDREGRDMVLLDVDRYESLVDEQYDSCGSFEDVDLYDMSEGQMLNKINRDIAVWRSHREEDERGHRARVLEQDLDQNPLPDPFEEDFSHSSDWHKAGSILADKHAQLSREAGRDDGYYEYEDESGLHFGKKSPLKRYTADRNETPDFGSYIPHFDDEDDEDAEDDEDFLPNFYPFGVDTEASEKSGGEDNFYDTREKREIPFVEHGAVEMRKDDDEDPVFFEEPI